MIESQRLQETIVVPNIDTQDSSYHNQKLAGSSASSLQPGQANGSFSQGMEFKEGGTNFTDTKPHGLSGPSRDQPVYGTILTSSSSHHSQRGEISSGSREQRPIDSNQMTQATLYGARIQQLEGSELSQILSKYGQVLKIVFTYKQMVFTAEMALRGFTKTQLYKEFAIGAHGRGWRFYDTVEACQQVQITDKSFCEIMTMEHYNMDASRVQSAPKQQAQPQDEKQALANVMYQKVCEGIGSNHVIGPGQKLPFVFNEMSTTRMFDGLNLNGQILGNMKELLDPDKLLNFLTFDAENFLRIAAGMLNENFLALTLQNIRVREIWISGHTPDMDIGGIDLKEICSNYGEIDGVDSNNKIGKSFAFVRFKKVSAAIKAFESIDEIARLMRRRIKISFSDFTKRSYIVGDSPTLTDNTDSLTQFLFAGFPIGCKLPLASKIRSLLAEFMPIRNLVLKEALNPGYRPFFLVEYETREQAIAARKHFYLDDINGNRRKLFGSAEMEMNVLVISTPVRKFEISAQMQSMDLTPAKQAYKEKNGTDRTSINEILKVFSPKVPKPKEQTVETIKKKTDQTFIEVPKLLQRELVWSGTLYKGPNHHFVSDIYHLDGDKNLVDKYFDQKLIVHELQEVPENYLNLPRQATFVVVPSNILQKKVAAEYVNEFNSNGYCAVSILTKKVVPHPKLFLIASSPKTRSAFPEMGEISLLGIIFSPASTSQMLNENTKKTISECTDEIMSDYKEKLIPHHEEEGQMPEDELHVSPERGEDFDHLDEEEETAPNPSK